MMDDWAFAAHLAAGGHAVNRRHFEEVPKGFGSRTEYQCGRNSGHRPQPRLRVCRDALAIANAGRTKARPHDNRFELLKIALDKRAGWLRERVGTLVASGIHWLDVQALTDPISFFGSNPALSCGFERAPNLKTMRIRFRMMLTPQSYAKGKFNLFRTHRQFVLGVERPYFYSMHMLACGPIPFARIWAEGGLAQEMTTISRP